MLFILKDNCLLDKDQLVLYNNVALITYSSNIQSFKERFCGAMDHLEEPQGRAQTLVPCSRCPACFHDMPCRCRSPSSRNPSLSKHERTGFQGLSIHV